MIPHVHQALAQVRELQARFLEKQYFKGYSGRARALSGTIALVAAIGMSHEMFPKTTGAHVVGWGVVFAIGLVLNYGALVYWFLYESGDHPDFRRIKPAFDVMPALFVGGVLTYALIRTGQYAWLPGVWMAQFGVAHLASQRVLPKLIGTVGWYYIACGTLHLAMGGLDFTNPWPMGLVFFCGEWAGGFVLHFDRRTNPSIVELLAEFVFDLRAGREEV